MPVNSTREALTALAASHRAIDQQTQTQTMTATAIGFVSYLLVVAAIGVYALKRTRTANDYVIGGRSLSAPVAALSAGASDMSGWLLLGPAGGGIRTRSRRKRGSSLA